MEKERFVMARHIGDTREYCFSVKRGVKIEPDDMLIADTIHGRHAVIATTGVLCGTGAMSVALKLGAYLPLKSIVAVIQPDRVRIVHSAADAFLEAIKPLPF